MNDNIEKQLQAYKKALFQSKSEIKVIRFYETDKPYGCFSNFAKTPIELDGRVWPTTEHYFQAIKFVGTPHEEELRVAPTAMEAARMGRDRARPLRKDWEDVKLAVMTKAVQAKVEQHPLVKDLLVSTGSCTLVEHTRNDAFWADNGDGTGLNWLGRILMEIREGLEDYSPDFLLPQWLVYPEHDPYSMFWRMGAGESYMMYYADWWRGLSEAARREYDAYFVPPAEWCLTNEE
ncbi:NADAR family protein [Paenibacillus oryzisoli]|uniref:NADAR family protein n=1 Tax=Paenibacillus oryzisoli TaxID=1850517 RepID=UPI003D2974E3